MSRLARKYKGQNRRTGYHQGQPSPFSEANLVAQIIMLSNRIERLEKDHLDEWKVALVVFAILSAIGVVVGIIFAILTLAG
ncbi:hypothetical protein ACFLXE_07005 [Chloroflexota bacterium]